MTDSFPPSPGDPVSAFLEASVWHGTLEAAEIILASHPEVAGASIHTAAVLGNEAAIRRWLQVDPANATAKDEVRGWDALTYLCFSKYLRLVPARSEDFLRAARALLDAGACANTGFFDPRHQPKPERESVLYAAAGVAHHADMTRLLLERGADPNDGETPYHAPETDDNAALAVLVESGRLSPESLATMLLRKADWHDLAGMTLLLQHGADPNLMTTWGQTALHQALRRDNDLAQIELLLDHGADPTLPNLVDRRSAVSIAARRGRGDVLALLTRRHLPVTLDGVESLIGACARDDGDAIRAILAAEPRLANELLVQGGTLLAEFAGVGNTGGVRHLLDLGVKVDAPYRDGDGYFGTAKDSQALHLAAWRARHDTLKLLLRRGAPVDALDGAGRSPLALAVRACTDSYWTHRRSPESVAALLDAGASPAGIKLPCGYEEVDRLFRGRFPSP